MDIEGPARLDTLARIFGVGLILFDAKAPKEPPFEIRARAVKREPDMFYVNRTRSTQTAVSPRR